MKKLRGGAAGTLSLPTTATSAHKSASATSSLLVSEKSPSAVTPTNVVGVDDSALLQLEVGTVDAGISLQDVPIANRLLVAVKSGNVAHVEALFNEAESPKHGMNDVANYVAPNGFPFLHWAALNDHTGLIDFLVDRGANVRQLNSRGEEALCWAALKGHRLATARLLRHGASEDAADDRGYTVRFRRCRCGCCCFDEGLALLCCHSALIDQFFFFAPFQSHIRYVPTPMLMGLAHHCHHRGEKK
jgi:hypothetical protein